MRQEIVVPLAGEGFDDYTVALLWSPGTVFILVSLITFFIYNMKSREISVVATTATSGILKAAPALIASLMLVQVFVNSGFNSGFVNGEDLSSMPNFIATNIASFSGSAWIIFAPIIGVIGSFVSGSATFSNLMFSSLQFDAAIESGLNPQIILALQTIGSNIGNMISVSNVVAVAAVVGISGQESKILRTNIVPTIIYISAIVVIGIATMILLDGGILGFLTN